MKAAQLARILGEMLMTNQLAKEVADAKEAGAEFDAKARELLTLLGTITEARWFDIGPGGRQLFVLPGWGPLQEPARFIHIATPG